MLMKIEKMPTVKKKKPFEIKLNNELKLKVEENWKAFVKEKEGYWDGELLSVTNLDLHNNTIEVGKAKFSYLIYSKTNSDLDVRSLFVSILFKTLDNKFVIIKNNHEKINIIGGIVEEEDLKGTEFNSDICLSRELKEELGLDLNNKNHVLSYRMKYLKRPNPGRNYGLVYIGTLNFYSQELIEYYNDKKEKLDNEIIELKLLSKDELDELDLSNDDISYLTELVNYELNEE